MEHEKHFRISRLVIFFYYRLFATINKLDLPLLHSGSIEQVDKLIDEHKPTCEVIPLNRKFRHKDVIKSLSEKLGSFSEEQIEELSDKLHSWVVLHQAQKYDRIGVCVLRGESVQKLQIHFYRYAEEFDGFFLNCLLSSFIVRVSFVYRDNLSLHGKYCERWKCIV